MVVLEGHNMLGVNNQYLQPDYLSPLPTTLDSKQSPLALLVATCSSIGADSGPSKGSIPHPSPLSSTDSNSSMSSSNSAAGQKRKASTSSDSGHGASLKSHSSESDSRPRSSGSTTSCSSAKQPRFSHSPAGHLMVNGKVSPNNKYSSANNNNNNESPSVINHSSKLRKLSGQSISSESSEKGRHQRSSPPTSHNSQSSSVIVPQGKQSSGSGGSRSPHITQSHEKSSREKSNSENNNNSSSSSKSNSSSSPKPASHQQDQGASPIIRSGLDVLQGKDLPKFGAFGAYPQFPPGFDPTNPAFRLPFLAAQHANFLGYPGGPAAAAFPTGSPYASIYARSAMKPGEGIGLPACKDPFCTGCSNGNVPSICPAGCASCDHQKFPLHPPSSAPYPSIPGFPPGLSHAALSALSGASGYPPSLLSHMMQQQQQTALALSAAQAQTAKPYVCNWNSDTYCGKRFTSSEELLQHLRTHTSTSGSGESAPVSSSHLMVPSSPASLYSSALLNSSAMAAAAAAMQRTYPYPTPPLNHQYAAGVGKPPAPMGMGPIPPPPSALAGYYSPYSLYGSRIG